MYVCLRLTVLSWSWSPPHLLQNLTYLYRHGPLETGCPRISGFHFPLQRIYSLVAYTFVPLYTTAIKSVTMGADDEASMSIMGPGLRGCWIQSVLNRH